MSTPRIWVSRVAVRMNEITGVVQRRTSSVAVSSRRSILYEPLPLIGSLGERGDPARDRVPRRLVARDQELVEEHHELVVAERLALDLGLCEHRDDVVARVGAAGARRLEQVFVHLGLEALALFRCPVGRAGYRRFRPLVEALPVGLGDAEELGDDPERKGDRERLDRVERLAGRDARDELVGAGAHPARRARACAIGAKPGCTSLRYRV